MIVKLPDKASSKISASCPLAFRCAETTTFVSRTALTPGTASVLAVASDLDVYLPQGELIEPLGFCPALNRRKGPRALHEVPEVILDAHNYRLRFPALIDDKALLIVFDPPEDLSELGPGGKRWYDFSHCFIGADG